MEENRKGPGIFYAVVGVATLVVAIIGATFAYFSARVDGQEGVITGSTNDNIQTGMSLSVTRVNYQPGEGVLDTLVPVDFDATTPAGVTAAVSKKCVDKYYTGCHVYHIEADTNQNLNIANIMVDLRAPAGDAENWKYLVYTGTEDAATAITTAEATFKSTNPANAFGQTGTDIHNKPLTTDGTDYYLVVYLDNINAPQNDAESEIEGATNETGTYNGTVTMYAANGQVKATFTAQGQE